MSKVIEEIARAIMAANYYAPRGTPDGDLHWKIYGPRYLKDAQAAYSVMQDKIEEASGGIVIAIAGEIFPGVTYDSLPGQDRRRVCAVANAVFAALSRPEQEQSDAA